MAKSVADQLMERRASLITKAQEIAQKGVTEDRDLSVEEQTSFDQMLAEADKLAKRAQAIAEGEQRANDLEESFRSATGREPERGGEGQAAEGKFGEWARSAIAGGPGFDVSGSRGTEARAIAKARGEEVRAMGMGGTDQDRVYSTLWEYAVEASELLQAGVQVINTDHGNSIPMPRVTAHAATPDTTVAPSGAITESDSTIGTVPLDVAKYAFVTYVPSELIQDTTFDVEGYIARNAGRQLGLRVAEVANAAAVAGFTTQGVEGTPVGGAPDYDGLVDLFHSVIPPYRSTSAFVMADPGAAAVRKIKNSNGDPIWQPALTAGNPDLILGKPVRIDPFLPAPGVGTKSIFFGDWSALAVRVAGGVRFERSNEFKFANDQVAFRAIVRTGSAALDPNAVKFFLGNDGVA